MSVSTQDILADAAKKIVSRTEGQFCDFKSKDIQPAKITKALSAFANADGGELFVGIEEVGSVFKWDGFQKEEDANGLIQAVEQFFPLGTHFRASFLRCISELGLVLAIEVDKTPDVRPASDGTPYLRRGAQSIPQKTNDQLNRLKLNKGIISFEDHIVNSNSEFISDSDASREFTAEIIPSAKPEDWLKKQKLIIDGKPTVAGVVLFADEPQIELPKAAIKIYRYTTNDPVGSRETLAFDPISMEGNAYSMIYASVAKVREIIERIPVAESSGLSKLEYPTEAVHEIITNAAIHRDYSINDDIHVRIFDNRIEVQSPGVLAGHVT
ncbi:RNA-binding domain-containing protein, partial [Bosea sp. TAB14]|uniref:AlbA family DNA-binding domain-containing protein n=1 Tax=Bosea sp. TAB14 TaxID=3237481 RepID=UPI003F91C09B